MRTLFRAICEAIYVQSVPAEWGFDSQFIVESDASVTVSVPRISSVSSRLGEKAFALRRIAFNQESEKRCLKVLTLRVLSTSMKFTGFALVHCLEDARISAWFSRGYLSLIVPNRLRVLIATRSENAVLQAQIMVWGNRLEVFLVDPIPPPGSPNIFENPGNFPSVQESQINLDFRKLFGDPLEVETWCLPELPLHERGIRFCRMVSPDDASCLQ